MANALDFQITEEGTRNAVIKLTGILTDSNISETPAIAMSSFLNNDQLLKLVGFRVDLIEWSISNGLEVNLAWHSSSPQQIYPLAGRGRICSTNYGGFIPDRTKGGYNGDIDLTTAGFTPGTVQNFTIVLELIKIYTQ